MSSHLSPLMNFAKSHPKTSVVGGLSLLGGLAYLGYRQWTKPKAVSGHWVGEQAVLPTSKMSPGVRSYLTETHMNLQHGTMETLNRRAEAHDYWKSAETSILQNTQRNLGRVDSDVFRMSSHMVHNERRLMFDRAGELRQAHTDTADATLTNEVTKMTTTRAQGTGSAYQSLVDMMVHGKQGPMTLTQSKLGIEATIVGHHVLGKTPKYGHDNPRMEAKRSIDPFTGKPSHAISSRYGIDLSQDPGTLLRDQLNLPIMMGTSGSASDVVRSYRYTQTALGDAPTLDPIEHHQALKELTFNWMRLGAPMSGVRGLISQHFTTQNFRKISSPPEPATQTHSFPEIAAGVDLTLHGGSSENLDTSTRNTQEFMKTHRPHEF